MSAPDTDHHAKMIFEDSIAMLYEIRGVYDGWSVARLKDGTLVNRWDPIEYPRRFAASEEFINGMTKEMEDLD